MSCGKWRGGGGDSCCGILKGVIFVCVCDIVVPTEERAIAIVVGKYICYGSRPVFLPYTISLPKLSKILVQLYVHLDL